MLIFVFELALDDRDEEVDDEDIVSVVPLLSWGMSCSP